MSKTQTADVIGLLEQLEFGELYTISYDPHSEGPIQDRTGTCITITDKHATFDTGTTTYRLCSRLTPGYDAGDVVKRNADGDVFKIGTFVGIEQ